MANQSTMPKDVPKPMRAKEPLNITQALYQTARQTDDAATQALQRAETIIKQIEQAKI